MTFYVGQKVVCVYAGGDPAFDDWDESERIVVGQIYTIRRVYIDHDGEDCVWLDEVQRSHLSRIDWGPDVGYGAYRFRPVVERKTDISIFEEILRNTKAPVTDDAFHKSHDMGAR